MFFFDEVFHAQLGRVLSNFQRQTIHHAFDGVYGFGYAERATVSYAAGWFVGVHRVHFRKGDAIVIRARTNGKHPRRIFGRVGRSIGIPVVSQGFDAQALDFAIFGGGQFTGHVIIPGKRISLEIFHTVFNPLHGFANEHRSCNGNYVAGIHRNFAPKTTPNIGGNDPNFFFRKAHVSSYQGNHRTNRVRCLGGHVHGEVGFNRVKIRDTTTGFNRGHVNARDVDLLFDHDFGIREKFVGGFAVTGFPVPNVVVGFTLIWAQDGHPRIKRFVGVNDGLHRLILHFHRSYSIGSNVAFGSDDRADFLGIVHYRVCGEHHLGIRHQGRHPVKVVLLQVAPGNDCQYARNFQGFGGIDVEDFGVGIRAAYNVHVQHAGQFDVVHVMAFALDEPGIFLTFEAVTQTTNFFGCIAKHELSI